MQKPVAFTVAQTTVSAALAIHIGFTTIRETPVLMLSRRNRDTDWLVAHLQARVCLDAYCISTKNAYTIYVFTAHANKSKSPCTCSFDALMLLVLEFGGA